MIKSAMQPDVARKRKSRKSGFDLSKFVEHAATRCEVKIHGKKIADGRIIRLKDHL
jgi:hypothetical protein